MVIARQKYKAMLFSRDLNKFAVIEPDLIHKKKFVTVPIVLQFLRNISKPRMRVKIILKTVGSHEMQTDVEKMIIK